MRTSPARSVPIRIHLRIILLSRVDFLVTDKNEIYFSEINSIPGMSEKSLFPQLFSASKISYEDLLNTMVSTALATKK